MISKEKLKTIESMLEGTRFLLIVDNGRKVTLLPSTDCLASDMELSKFVKKALIKNTDFAIIIIYAMEIVKQYFLEREKQ
jgi:hypothetical protein